MQTLKDILIEYKSQFKAIPAFNIDSFEIYQAIELAVKTCNFPCIVQLSPGEDKFIEAEKLFLLVHAARASGLPIYLNMDHGKDISRLLKLISLGYDMVHFDGSALDYRENLIITRHLVTEARKINPNILIEAEFNKINLIDTGVSSESFTDPQKAREFMLETNADLLAVSIGNLHGVNTTFPEKIDLTRLSEINNLLPKNCFITLHGGSGIDPIETINALPLGIAKVNINTDLRLKFRKSLGFQLSTNESERIYDYLGPVITELTELIIQKINFFRNSYV